MEELVFSNDFVAFASRDPVLNEIMETLRDETVSIIGIWGMGGIGKTTLVTEVGKKAKDEGLFDSVLLTVVSQRPDMRRIQGLLADMLGLMLKGTSEVERATELAERIGKLERVLIILDDVWNGLNLADVGIPSRLDHKGCKIVITTRLGQVCDDMCCQRKVRLNVLHENEALFLFVKHAKIGLNSGLRSLAKKVVKECGGLPLAIETVGSALRNKSSKDYGNAINMLSHSKFVDIESVDKEIYPAIALSVNYLKCEETVACLFLCSLYPEDSEIDLEDFTRIAFGLGLFENVNSVEEARQNTLKCIQTLLDACLLPNERTFKSWESISLDYKPWTYIKAQGDMYYRYMPCVKMHDIVRDVALWLSAKRQIFYMATSSTKLPKKRYEVATGISMKCTDQDCSLPGRLNCPKLKILLLEIHALGLNDDCFEMMSALQVLNLTVSYVDVDYKLPVSIQHLHSLRTFHIDTRYTSWFAANDLPIIGRLKNLQILCFKNEDCLMELPQEIKELTGLRILDLSRCPRLRNIPRNVLSCLTALEELYAYYPFNDFQLKDDLLSELASLPHLTTLSARVHCIGRLSLLRFKNPLQRYAITSSMKDRKWCGASRSLSLHVADSSEMAVLQQLFPQVEHLRIACLEDTLENPLPTVDHGCFENVSVLHIVASRVDCLVDTTKSCHPKPIFSNLENLKLGGMTRMTRLCKGPTPPGWFRNLRNARMGFCDRSQNIVPHMIPIGPKLEVLDVWECPRLKHIFEFDPEDLQHIKNEVSLFPCPKEIHLKELPELKGIWRISDQWEAGDLINRGNHDESGNLILEAMLRCLNFVAKIKMECCEKTEEVFPLIESNSEIHKGQVSNLVELQLSKLCQLRCIWKGAHQSLHLHKLECVEIDGCDKLKSIFTCSSARSLHKLRSIKIAKCGAVEAIIAPDKDEFSASCTEFSALTTVSIPELEKIEISSCGELKSILPVSVLAQGLPKLTGISIEDCAKLEQVFGDVNETVPKREEITLNSLRSLTLSKLPILVCFSTVCHHLICPSLRYLTVKWCPIIDTSFSHPLHGLVHRKEQNLEDQMFKGNLNEYCREIVPTASLQSWVSLQSVVLADFHEVEELFDYNGMDIDQEHQISCSQLKGLHLESLTALNQIWKAPIHSVQLKYLNDLHVEECPNLRTLFPSCIAGALPKLKEIKIIDCKNLEIILATGGGQYVNEFDFPELSRIEIYGCQKLKSVLPLSVAQKLAKLATLVIEDSPVLQHVFSANEGKQREHGESDEIKLPKLRSLKLAKVPRSVLFTTANPAISCPALGYLSLEGSCSGDPTDQTPQPSLPGLECIWKGPTNLINSILLSDLEVVNCATLKKSLFSRSIAQKLRSLRSLHVYNCKGLKYIVEPRDHDLENEKGRSCSSVTCLAELREIEVQGCESLKFIFPLSVAQRLPMLQKMVITGACQLEQVIGNDRENKSATDTEIVLPGLRILKLEDLPCLQRMFPEGFSLNRASIVELRDVFIKNCNIEELFDLSEETERSSQDEHEEGSHSSSSSSSAAAAAAASTSSTSIGLLNLRKIEVEGCERLRSIFPLSVAQKLLSLKKMSVKGASQLEQLFMDDRRTAESNEIVLPELRILELQDLLCLSHILPAGYVVSTPSFSKLSAVFIKNCSIEEVFDCTLIHEGSYLGPVFASLTVLYLCCLPNLIHIWKIAPPYPFMGFNKLKSVYVQKCQRLRIIFPSEQYFPALETVHAEGEFTLFRVFNPSCPLWMIWYRVPRLRIMQLGQLAPEAISSEQSAFDSYAKLVRDNKLFDLESQLDADVNAAFLEYRHLMAYESRNSKCSTHGMGSMR